METLLIVFRGLRRWFRCFVLCVFHGVVTVGCWSITCPHLLYYKSNLCYEDKLWLCHTATVLNRSHFRM